MSLPTVPAMQSFVLGRKKACGISTLFAINLIHKIVGSILLAVKCFQGQDSAWSLNQRDSKRFNNSSVSKASTN